MDTALIAARAVHYAATVSLAGGFAFRCFVASPAISERLRRQLSLLAWASLGVALISGAAWLLFLAAQMSGQPVGTALSQGIIGTVLNRTRFGQVWTWRFLCTAMTALLLLLPQAWHGRLWRWVGLALAAAVLGSLAWAGHGGDTPGRPGDLHLAADILHLIAAGAWVGSLIPLALLLGEARRSGALDTMADTRGSVRRFSVLAASSVAILFAAGLVNTWFLAGTVPALIGTEYGRLLLAKIAIFATMAIVAAVNLLRMTPRLAPAARERLPLIRGALGHLRRNALVEAGLGLCVLGIVAVLGILPPGLHTEPGWPLPFRIDPAALSGRSQAAAIVLDALAAVFALAGLATAAAGHYRAMTAAWGGLALCVGAGWLALRPAIEPAYPTTFYAPAEPYAAASVAQGARLYAANCALCHGAQGKGDGPAAAGLAVHPADLTAPHLFAHTEGDLFWWVTNGKANGAMPGFAEIMNPAERWDVINFIRARAAGVASRRIGPDVSTASAPAIPDFAFEAGGQQQTLDRLLRNGPVLIALFSGPPPAGRLALLASSQPQLAAAGLRALAIDLAPPAAASPETAPPPLVGIAHDVAATLGLFRAPEDAGETELLLDRSGRVRARWTAGAATGLPDAATLVADTARVARFPAAPANHAGHAH